MQPSDRTLPDLLRKLCALEYLRTDGEFIDFEPYEEFLPPAETQEWFRAWTGNPAADGAEFLVFGQDGTGGHAAIWTARTAVDLLEQPVVFFGSEGELGIVASSVFDYLWLLAAGVGPYEAVAYPEDGPEQPGFAAIAYEHAGSRKKSVAEVLAKAQAEFPGFEAGIQGLCE